MSPRLGNLLIVVAAAAVACAALIGIDSRVRRRPASALEPSPVSNTIGPMVNPSNDSRESSQLSNASAELNPGRPRLATSRGVELGTESTAASAVEEFQVWLRRYLESNPDRKQLRRELEEALARLPTDDGETEAAGEIAAIEALRRAELKAGIDYRSLMDSAEQFIERFARSSLAAEAKELFEKYARAWDDDEFQAAREFAQANPQSFDTQLARFQTYIDHHGVAGKWVADAHAAVARIRADWAEHDYRQIHDFATRYPSDLGAVATRVRRFLDNHAGSHHHSTAEQFLARYERAATPREYRLRVKSGSFVHSIGRTISSGPDLAVEIEVAGIRVGRTPIVADSFEPAWNYEFPQSVRWRLGDAVRIRVIDFDYSNRTILKIEPPADDPLAMRYLTGTITADGHQLIFESDFHVPTLPAP